MSQPSPSRPVSDRHSLLGVTPEEVAEIVRSLGEPAFRAKQIVEWIFKNAPWMWSPCPACPNRCGKH